MELVTGSTTAPGILAVLCAAAAAAALTGVAPARRRLARLTVRHSRAGPGPPLFKLRTSASSRRETIRDPSPGDLGPTGSVIPSADRSGDDVLAGGSGDSTGDDGFLASPLGRAAAATSAALGTALILGGAVGVVVGVAAGAGAWFWLGRLEPPARVRERESIEAALPLAADLIIAALHAGCPPAEAVEAVGEALGGPIGRALRHGAVAARLGSDPAAAWTTLGERAELAALGRALAAATARGTSPVSALERVAHDAREASRWAAESRARGLGARAAAPLGLCFLPAFVLLGIVPVIATSGLTLP